MSRLTERYFDGTVGVAECGNNCKYGFRYCEDCAEQCPAFNEIYNKLAHYEDLEEQGRLIELPCKVGDTVWNVNEYTKGFKIRPMKACCIVVKGNNKKYVYLEYTDTNDYLEYGYGFDDFGTILFLTKEEAEKALAKLKGE